MAVIKTIIRVTDALSATIVSVANLIVLFTNTAGANEKIDDRLLLHPPWKGGAARVLARAGTKYATHRQIKSPSQEGDLGGG